MFNTTPGGVIPHIFVNPNGSPYWSPPAFNQGYISALNQNAQFPIAQNGGDVNSAGVDWTQQYDLFRRIAENLTVTSFVDNLANSSINGANYWSPIFTHSLINDYLFNDFAYDFNYIATTYGAGGSDNILMTSDEEILNYLSVRDAIGVNYVLNGTSLLITFSGQIPNDLLYYSSSLIINSDATINNIIVDGTNDYTQNGIGTTDALINLNWDGHTIIPALQYADSMVSIASATLNRYDCWIAMDYVITLENGNHKDSLRQVLCDIPNIIYDEGFCYCEIIIQPIDTTVNEYDCIYLFGAQGDYTYEWFIGDSLVDTSQDIYTCPVDTTQYNHIATNTYGCPAEDSIMVNVNFLNFDLGPDTTICDGNCVEFIGPPDMENYWWIVADTIFDTVQIIEPCPIDTTMYKLIVEDALGATAEDSITINVLPSPEFTLQPQDTTIAFGDCVELTGPDGNYSYYWYIGDSIIDSTQIINTCPEDTTQYNLIIVNSYDCTAEDSMNVYINFLSFDLGPDTTVCENECYTLTGPPDMAIYNWIVADTIYDTIQIIEPCPMDTTKYTLWVENDSGITAEDSITLNVLTAPIVDFEDDSLWVCYGDDVDLSVVASQDVDLYVWYYNGEDSTTTIDTYTLINVEDSANVFVGVVSTNECTAVDSVYLSVLPYPEITVNNDTTICPNDSLTLSMQGGSHFYWTVNEDTISTDSVVKVKPGVKTDYVAHTAFADSLCYAFDTVKVDIFDSALTKIVYDTNTVCTYAEINLVAEGAAIYIWLPGNDTTDTYSFIIFDTTTIWLTGTTSDGCSSIDSVEFFNKPAPDVNFTGLFPAFCENDSPVDLVGTPPGGTFSGSGHINDQFVPGSAGPGTHEIIYSFTNAEGCIGMDTNVTIVYGNGGTIDLGDDFTLQLNESKNIDAGLGFDSYFWTTGENTQSITVLGTEKPTGTYEYVVIGVIHGCSTRGSVFVSFEGPDGVTDNNVSNLTIFPNPNTGNFTVRFNSVEKDIQIRITSIQGQLIGSYTDIVCDEDCSTNIVMKGVKPGFYLLQIITPKGINTTKVILK